MGDNKDKINNAMRAFGGTVMDNTWYWGKEKNSSNAWYVDMYGGYVFNNFKFYTYRVRAVAPVPAASAR